MQSYKVKMLFVDEEGISKLKSLHLDADKISSVYIDDPIEIGDNTHKLYNIICDGEFFSIKNEPHIYTYLYNKFFKNPIKTE